HGYGQGRVSAHEGLENLDLYEMMLRVVVDFSNKDQSPGPYLIDKLVK
ncbi:unnamed protein product, partial [marine sediment metagenome]